MSKYYKAEDVINALADQWHYEATMEYPDTAGDIEEWKQNASELFADLPTIEVSEDCISREYMLSKVYDMDNDNLVVDLKDIEDAPSVVPSITEDRDTQVLDNWQVHHRNTTSAVEDCISRECLSDKVGRYYAERGDFGSFECSWILDAIKDAPSVVPSCQKNRQVGRAEGEWVRNFDGNEWYWYCTNCKTQWYEDDLWMGGNEFPNYCPNCGAKMKGANDVLEGDR